MQVIPGRSTDARPVSAAHPRPLLPLMTTMMMMTTMVMVTHGTRCYHHHRRSAPFCLA